MTYILLACLLLLAACSDSDVSEPSDTGSRGCFIGYSVNDYSGGLRSSLSRAETEVCEKDLNETVVNTIDLYLLDKDGKIMYNVSKTSDNGDPISNDCKNTQEENDIHYIVYLKHNDEGRLSIEDASILEKTRKIAIVANYTNRDKQDIDNCIGKTLEDLYPSIISNPSLTGLVHDAIQPSFVMYGEMEVPLGLIETANIVVPLHRIAAKIRIKLQNADGKDYTSTFYSMLCRYATTSKVLPDPDLPAIKTTGGLDGNNPYATAVNLCNIDPSGAANSDADASGWEYPSDRFIKTKGIVRNNSQIFYTYPTDWIDYSKVTKGCYRLGNTGHDDTEHYADRRYAITDYDDRAPVLAEREMFILVLAQYSKDSKWYYYKVPINYRFSDKNDQQCYSIEEITNEIFPLYRAERNTYYDITARIDIPGGATPEEAIMITAFSTVDIQDLGDGGTFDLKYSTATPTE